MRLRVAVREPTTKTLPGGLEREHHARSPDRKLPGPQTGIGAYERCTAPSFRLRVTRSDGLEIANLRVPEDESDITVSSLFVFEYPFGSGHIF